MDVQLKRRDVQDIKASLGSSIPAIIATSPLEIIKMNAQVTSHNVTIRGMFRDVYKNHGVRGFYKGLGVSLCGQPMFWALYHPIKNNLRDHFANEDGSIDFWAKSGTIFAASLTASMTVNPLFVLKTRFQTSVLKTNPDGILKYRNIRYSQMIKDIFRNEGFSAFYKGNFVAQIKNTQLVPQMLLYEFFNEWSLNPLSDSNLFITDRSFVSGVAAKTIASCVVYYPVDVIRTNIRDKTTRVSIPTIIKEIYNRPGGLLNFYRGVGVYWISAIPTFGLITFGMNKLQTRLRD
jgi:solute carrier family 25 folate transporter 32